MDAVALQNLGDGISSHCDPPQDGVRYRFLDALERCGGLSCRPGSARACQSASRKTFYHCIEVLVPHLRGGSCVVFGKCACMSKCVAKNVLPLHRGISTASARGFMRGIRQGPRVIRRAVGFQPSICEGVHAWYSARATRHSAGGRFSTVCAPWVRPAARCASMGMTMAKCRPWE